MAIGLQKVFSRSVEGTLEIALESKIGGATVATQQIANWLILQAQPDLDRWMQ
ncbi:hypothetical protein [Neobacillus cucumis]|uniref:hypothetical protein n=1 Tax=Neobacillus cucumis TaxID=1740721 RepID=UPI0028536DE6|nr:hypothetical protein [Neobacillus cucumis]MDR4950395.1 hypothetical protein [Neobacillus cucumis]